MKRLVVLLLVFILSLAQFPVASAHDDQGKHDQDLKYALFDDKSIHLSGNQRLAFRLIADAAAISIDQFSTSVGQRAKETTTFNVIQQNLHALGLNELSIKFDEIDLNKNVSPKKDKNIDANTHRKFTHMGWNYKKYPNPEFWKLRKQVMLDVTNRLLFNSQQTFSWVPWLSDALYAPSEQCDAFCAMVYYIHILGDHIEGNTANKLTDLEPLIQYTNWSTPGIITELKEQLHSVFPSQVNGWTFNALMQQLENLHLRAERELGLLGKIDNDDECKINQKYASDLLDILASHLPQLLRNEQFFASRFS